MDTQVYEKTFDMIQGYLPDGWTKMILFAGYTEGSYSINFYASINGAAFIDCFHFEGVEKSKLFELFMSLDDILQAEREKCTKKERWTIFTMTVDANGGMQAYFEYDDHSEDMIEYERQWKEKYLVTD